MLHLLKTQLEPTNQNDYTLPPLLLKPEQQTIILEPALMAYLDKLSGKYLSRCGNTQLCNKKL